MDNTKIDESKLASKNTKIFEERKIKVNYKLNERFEKMNNDLEEKISINKEKIKETQENLVQISQNKTMDPKEKRIKKLSLEIKLDILENEEFTLNHAQRDIYVNQAMENLKKGRINGEVDSKDFIKYKKEIEFYKAFSQYKWDKNFNINTVEINRMKLKLEHEKQKRGIIENVDTKYITKLNEEIRELEEHIESLKDFDLKYINKDVNKYKKHTRNFF